MRSALGPRKLNLSNRAPTDCNCTDNCVVKLMSKCDFSRGALPSYLLSELEANDDSHIWAPGKGAVGSLVRCKEMKVSAQKYLWMGIRTATSFTTASKTRVP